MSWLGASGFSRDAMQSLGAAYASMNQPQQTTEEAFEQWLDGQLEGGADLSEFTTDEVYDYYVNEVLEEGKKDACYHKVKSRYDVWPSAYASGALVKCRAKGAKNWGNSTKKEEVEHKQQQEIYSALQDAYNMMYEKKKDSDKCGEGTYWDKEDKKCKKKKSSSKTTVVVGRGGYYGGGHHHGGSNGGGDTDPDTDGGDGGDGGGDGGGGE